MMIQTNNIRVDRNKIKQNLLNELFIRFLRCKKKNQNLPTCLLHQPRVSHLKKQTATTLYTYTHSSMMPKDNYFIIKDEEGR